MWTVNGWLLWSCRGASHASTQSTTISSHNLKLYLFRQKISIFYPLKSEDKTGNPFVASERMDGLSNGQKDFFSTLENEQKVF